MIAWWNQLQKRERWLLCLCAALLFGYLVVTLVATVFGQGSRLADENAALRASVIHVNQMVADIQAANPSSALTPEIAAKSLAELAELAAKQADIRIQRFQPRENNSAQIWLDAVPFEQWLDFVQLLESQWGIQMEQIVISAQDEPGIINARMSINK